MALEKPKHGMPFAAPPTAEMLEDTDDGQMFPTLNAMIDTIPKVDFGPAPTFEAPDFDKHLGAIQGHLDGLSDHFNKHVLGAGEPGAGEPGDPEWKRHHEPKNTADMAATIGQRLLWSLLVIGAHLFAATCFDAKAELVMLFGSIAQLYATWWHTAEVAAPPPAAKPQPSLSLKPGLASAEAEKLRAALELSALGRPVAGSSMARAKAGATMAEHRANSWDEVSAEVFKLRGKNYLKDKVKVPSLPALYDGAGMDVFRTPMPVRARPRASRKRATSDARASETARARVFPRDAHRSPTSPRS